MSKLKGRMNWTRQALKQSKVNTPAKPIREGMAMGFIETRSQGSPWANSELLGRLNLLTLRRKSGAKDVGEYQEGFLIFIRKRAIPGHRSPAKRLFVYVNLVRLLRLILDCELGEMARAEISFFFPSPEEERIIVGGFS